MLFKGTPSFPDIPQALRERGARFNGTTWLDRTHYYETLPSSDENLEFAIKLESERMTKTEIEDDVLRTELDVVRNELLRGENNPSRVLFQRVQAAAFARHGYGHPTIGLMDDLNVMTPDDLRGFFRKHYVAERTVLVIAGDFEVERAKELVATHFRALPSGDPGDRAAAELESQLREPPQDGERSFNLYRVTEVNELVAAYHIPAGGHVDFPLIQIVIHLLGLRPTGLLYRNLIDTSLAARVSCVSLSLHDPGLVLASVDVAQEEHCEEAEQRLLATVEQELIDSIDEAQVDRARNEILKRRALEIADTSQLAIALTEPIAVGDWRYYFLQQERLTSATVDDVKRVCREYLVPQNRTLGRLIAGKRDIQTEIPDRDSNDLVAQIKTDVAAPVEGEPFDPSPRSMEASLQHGTIGPQFRFARLQRATRAAQVTFLAHVRIGDQDSLQGQNAATNVLSEWLPRGTQNRDHVAVQDALREQKAWVQSEGFRGGCSFDGQVSRESLPAYLDLVREMIREPRLEDHEFDVLRSAALSSYDQQRTQPASIAANELRRRLAVHPSDDVRYVATIDEKRQAMESLTPDDCRALYESCFCGQMGELVLIGPDLEQIDASQFGWLENWNAATEPERIVEAAQINEGDHVEIHIADKSNIGFSAGMNLALRDDHEDYPALVLANYVFGGATLVSRLSSEVRGKRGLSYSIYSGLNAHPIDLRGRFTIAATTNPENRAELAETVIAQLDQWVNDGLSTDEVEQGKASLLASRFVARAKDRNVASMVATQEFAGRTLGFLAKMDERIEGLGTEEINEAVRRWIEPQRMIYVQAGDLKSAGK